MCSSEGATACVECVSSTCNLTVDGVCGRGCGYHRYLAPSGECSTCPVGTFNADNACAADYSACATARVDVYVAADGSIASCDAGSVANAYWSGCMPCAPGTLQLNL